MADGTVLVEIRLTEGQFLNALKSVEGATKSSTETINRSFNSIETNASAVFNRIRNSILKMGAAIGVTFGLHQIYEFGKECAFLAARVETLYVAVYQIGKNMGYTNSQMDTFIDKVRAKGITTREAATNVLRLAQANVNLEKSEELARAAQDTAVIAYINSSEAFERLTHGMVSGQTEVLRTLGIQVDFQGALNNTARQLNKTTLALSEKEKMDAKVNAVLKETNKLYGIYEESMKTAGKQLTTLPRFIEEVKLKLGEAFGPAMFVFFDGLNKRLKAFGEYLATPDMQMKIMEWAHRFESWAKVGWQAFGVIVDACRWFFKTLEELEPIIVAVAVALTTYMVTSLIQTAANFIAAGDAALTLRNALGWLMVIATKLHPVLIILSLAVGVAAYAFMKLRGEADKTSEKLQSYLEVINNQPLMLAERTQKTVEEKLKRDQDKLIEVQKRKAEVEGDVTKWIFGAPLGEYGKLQDQEKQLQASIKLGEQQVAEGNKVLAKRREIDKQQEEAAKIRRKALEEDAEAARLAGLKVVKIDDDLFKIKTQSDKIYHDKNMAALEQAAKLNQKYYQDDTAWIKDSTEKKLTEVNRYAAVQSARINEEIELEQVKRREAGREILTKQDEAKLRAAKQKVLAEDVAAQKQKIRYDEENQIIANQAKHEEAMSKFKEDRENTYHDRVLTDIEERANAMRRLGINEVKIASWTAEEEIKEIERVAEQKKKRAKEAAERKPEGYSPEELAAEQAAIEDQKRQEIYKKGIEKQNKIRETNYNQAKQWEDNLFNSISFHHDARLQYIDDEAKLMELAGVSEMAILQKGYADRMAEENAWYEQRLSHLERMKQEDITAGKFDESKYWGDLIKIEQEHSKTVYENDKRRYIELAAFGEKRLNIEAELAKTADALSQETFEKEVERLQAKLNKDYEVTQNREAIQKAFTAQVLKLQQDRLQGEINLLEQTLGFDQLLYQKRIESINLLAQTLANTEWGEANPAVLQELISLKVIDANDKMRNSINSVTQSIRDMDVGLSEISFGDKMADGINKVVSSLENVNKVLEKQRKVRAELATEQEKADAIAPNDPAKAEAMYKAIDDKREEMFSAQIGSWRKVASAMKDYFAEGSAGYKAMHTLEVTLGAIEMALSIKKMMIELTGLNQVAQARQAFWYQAINEEGEMIWLKALEAEATAGTGEPFGAPVRVALMMALMAPLLAAVGKSGSGAASTASAASAATPVLPKSTILGAKAGTESESIQKSAQLLNEIYSIEYTELKGMHAELRDMNKNLEGFTASILRSGLATGSVFGTPGNTTVFLRQLTDTLGDTLSNPLFGLAGGAAGAALAGATGALSILTGGMIGMMLAPILGPLLKSFLGGLIGGKKTAEVKGLGVAIEQMSVAAAQAGQSVQAYNYQLVEFKKQGALWGLIGSKKWTEENKAPLERQAQRQLNYLMRDISNTLVNAAKGLGTDVNAALGYIFPAGRIDLKGLDEEASAKKIQAYFNAMSDNAAEALFGGVVGVFQKVGEGMYETVQRLIIDKGVVTELLKMTGMSVAKMDARNIVELSESLIDLAGSLQHLQEITKGFYEKFYTEGQKFHRDTRILTDVLGQVGLSLPATREGYRTLVEGADILTESGRKAYITLLESSEVADQYYSYQEDQLQKLQEMERSFFTDFASDIEKFNASLDEMSQLFVNFGLSVIPGTKEKFKEMIDQMDKGSDQYKAFLAAEQSANEFYSQLERQRQTKIDAARKELDSAYNRENQRLNDAINTASENLNELKTAYDRIVNARKSMVNQTVSGGLTKSQYAEALKELENAIVKSKHGEKYELSDKSLQIFQGGEAKKLFSSQQDYMRAYYKTYNQLGELEDSANRQLTDQQKMVETLKSSQKELEKIYDVLVNGEESTKDLRTAIDDFKKSMEDKNDVLIDTGEFTAQRVGDVDDSVMREIQGEVKSAYDNAAMIDNGIVQTQAAMNANHADSKSFFASILGGIWDAISWLGNSLGNVFKSVGGGIGNLFKSIGKGIGKIFGFHQGGIVDTIPRLHQGGDITELMKRMGGKQFGAEKLKSDEMLAILQKGELVVPEDKVVEITHLAKIQEQMERSNKTSEKVVPNTFTYSSLKDNTNNNIPYIDLIGKIQTQIGRIQTRIEGMNKGPEKAASDKASAQKIVQFAKTEKLQTQMEKIQAQIGRMNRNSERVIPKVLASAPKVESKIPQINVTVSRDIKATPKISSPVKSDDKAFQISLMEKNQTLMENIQAQIGRMNRNSDKMASKVPIAALKPESKTPQINVIAKIQDKNERANPYINLIGKIQSQIEKKGPERIIPKVFSPKENKQVNTIEKLKSSEKVTPKISIFKQPERKIEVNQIAKIQSSEKITSKILTSISKIEDKTPYMNLMEKIQTQIERTNKNTEKITPRGPIKPEGKTPQAIEKIIRSSEKVVPKIVPTHTEKTQINLIEKISKNSEKIIPKISASVSISKASENKISQIGKVQTQMEKMNKNPENAIPKIPVPEFAPTEFQSTPPLTETSTTGNAELIREIKELKDIIQRGNHQIGLNTLDTAKQLKRWDGNGLPREREE